MRNLQPVPWAYSPNLPEWRGGKHSPLGADITGCNLPLEECVVFRQIPNVSKRPQLQLVTNTSALPAAHGDCETETRQLLARALKANR